MIKLFLDFTVVIAISGIIALFLIPIAILLLCCSLVRILVVNSLLLALAITAWFLMIELSGIV
jgi:hypothetical protein